MGIKFGNWPRDKNQKHMAPEENAAILAALVEVREALSEYEVVFRSSTLLDMLLEDMDQEVLAKLAVYVSVLVYHYGSCVQGLMRKELDKIMEEIRPKEVTPEDIANML